MAGTAGLGGGAALGELALVHEPGDCQRTIGRQAKTLGALSGQAHRCIRPDWRAYSYTVRAFDAAMPANVSMDSATANVTTPASSPSSGLDVRPANASCIAPARPQPGTGVQLARAFPALTFTLPVGIYIYILRIIYIYINIYIYITQNNTIKNKFMSSNQQNKNDLINIGQFRFN